MPGYDWLRSMFPRRIGGFVEVCLQYMIGQRVQKRSLFFSLGYSYDDIFALYTKTASSLDKNNVRPRVFMGL